MVKLFVLQTSIVTTSTNKVDRFPILTDKYPIIFIETYDSGKEKRGGIEKKKA